MACSESVDGSVGARAGVVKPTGLGNGSSGSSRALCGPSPSITGLPPLDVEIDDGSAWPGGVWRVSGLGVISGPLRFMSGRHEGLRFFRMALTHHTRSDDFLIHKYEYKILTHRLSKYKLTKTSTTTVVGLVVLVDLFSTTPASGLCLFLLLTPDDRRGSIVVSKKACLEMDQH